MCIDDTRSWGPPFKNSESTYFLGINRNKRSIAIDFKTTKGLKIIQELVKNSDVLVENYIPGKLDQLGLGYKDLIKINPKLIYASISGYGNDGPFKNKPGYDVIIEAEAGLMHITGEKDGNPVKVGVAITDLTTGLYTKSAILAALFSRERTGKGQKIDVSLLECQIASLANIGHNYLIGNQEAERLGTSHASIAPYQAFQTKDGRIVIGTGNDQQYENFCDLIEFPELKSNPKFSSNVSRVKNRKELIKLIENKLKLKTTQEWMKILENGGFPFGPINNMEKTFAHPQVIHRKMIEEINHPTAGNIKLIGIPVKYSNTPGKIKLPPPLLGQHTKEILKELGKTDLEIDNLLKQNVIK